MQAVKSRKPATAAASAEPPTIDAAELGTAQAFIDQPIAQRLTRGDYLARASAAVQRELCRVQSQYKELPAWKKYARLRADLRTAKAEVRKAQDEVEWGKARVAEAVDEGEKVAEAEKAVREARQRAEELENRVGTIQLLISKARKEVEAALRASLDKARQALADQYEKMGEAFVRNVATFLRGQPLDEVCFAAAMVQALYPRVQSIGQTVFAEFYRLPDD